MWGVLNKNEIDDFLKLEWLGRIGCSDSNKIYVVPVTFAYDAGYIYGHTKDGLKIHMMRNNPSVCFEVDSVIDLNNWKSVIIHGNFEELNGDGATKGLEIIMERLKSLLNKKFSPSKMQIKDNIDIENFAFQHSFLSPFLHSENKEIAGLVVYRIKVIEITGKFGNDREIQQLK